MMIWWYFGVIKMNKIGRRGRRNKRVVLGRKRKRNTSRK
jgi:hypothetical protein